MAVSSNKQKSLFLSTDWSVVHKLNGPEAEIALTAICERYWFPIYAFVRSRTRSPDKAEDLTQGFFAHLIERDKLRHVAPERGRLRAFLLTSVSNYMINQTTAENAQRRGGRQVRMSLDFVDADRRFQRHVISGMSADRIFDRSWTLQMLDRVLEQLRTEVTEAGHADRFEVLKPMLTGDETDDASEQAATRLGMTPAAVRQAASRLRKRYRELLKAEVTLTLVEGSDLDDEIRSLFASLDPL